MKGTLGARKRLGQYLIAYGGWTWVEHDRGPGIRPDGSAVSILRGPLGLEAIVYSRPDSWVKDWIRAGRGREKRLALFMTPSRKIDDTLALVPVRVLAELTVAYMAQHRLDAALEMDRRNDA